MAIRSEELMIGDFVKVAKDKICIEKGTIVRVSSIDGDDILREKGLKGCVHCVSIDDRSLSGGVWEEYLEPIPLTPEILEKNGWKHPYWWENPDCQFGLVKYTEGSWAEGKWGVMFNMEDNDPSFLINYVHELQHLYRLCGIDKEIIL